MPSILAVTPTYPPAPGGAEMSLHETCRRLVVLGYRVQVLTLADSPSLLRATAAAPAHETVDGVLVRRATRQTIADWLDHELLQHHDAVFYQLHQLWLGLGLALSRTLRPHRARLVYFARAHQHDVHPAAVTVANSRWMRDELARHHPATGRVLVLYPPVVAPVMPGGRSRDYVTVINPVVHKGGHLVAELARRLPEVPFLVQHGWARQVVDGLEGLPNVVSRAPTSRIGDTYAETRLLLVPSQREPFGRVALEGALCGCLVLAHRTQGLQEVPLPESCFVASLSADDWEHRVRSFLALDAVQARELCADIQRRAAAFDCGFESFTAALAAHLALAGPIVA